MILEHLPQGLQHQRGPGLVPAQAGGDPPQGSDPSAAKADTSEEDFDSEHVAPLHLCPKVTQVQKLNHKAKADAGKPWIVRGEKRFTESICCGINLIYLFGG